MSQNQPFRENYVGAGKWRALAEWMNRVGRCLNNLRAGQGVDIEPNVSGGFDISVPGRMAKGGEIPPAPNSPGIHLLVCISYDGELKTYSWEKAPEGSGHNGYVPVLNHDPMGSPDGATMTVEWVDVSELRN